jgi:hypothetical protein
VCHDRTRPSTSRRHVRDRSSVARTHQSLRFPKPRSVADRAAARVARRHARRHRPWRPRPGSACGADGIRWAPWSGLATVATVVATRSLLIHPRRNLARHRCRGPGGIYCCGPSLIAFRSLPARPGRCAGTGPSGGPGCTIVVVDSTVPAHGGLPRLVLLPASH